jgi:predicted dienelactone hydrolase
MTSRKDEYDPFARGRFPVGVRTILARDSERDRKFPCEIWYPAIAQHAGEDLAPETQDKFTGLPRNVERRQMAVRNATAESQTCPLILFSHPSGGGRRAATFLCTHLSSHGYVVAACDHSEIVAPELARRERETDAEKHARWKSVIASRVPDIRFLLDRLLKNDTEELVARIDPDSIAIVGHSFGGWTALAAAEVEDRIGVVVALAPGGASKPKPGILPLEISFAGVRDVPTLYIVAENDTSLPLAGMNELFDRTPSTKQMVILRHADHAHFMDEVEELHEAFRTMPTTGDLAAIQKEMKPIAELCSGQLAHLAVRGLALCFFDAMLQRRKDAQLFLERDIESELARRGVDVLAR